ncbi:hypothetical protein Tco_1276917 [Tanacetum coccineum]
MKQQILNTGLLNFRVTSSNSKQRLQLLERKKLRNLKKDLSSQKSSDMLYVESSQQQFHLEAASSLTKFELKKILIDKMDESQSYMTVVEHRECYDRLIKSYDLDKSLFSTYDKVYSLKRNLNAKKSVQTEELEFEVANSDMPQDQEENLGNDDYEPKRKVVSKCDWFAKPKQPEEPTDPDWNAPAFKLLKGTRTNFVELEYDFEECYKALSEKLDWDNPEGGDYPFDLTKPLPLVMNGNRQMVPVDYFFNNDLKYLQGGISTMTYTTSTTKTKAAQYDLQGIEDMVPNIWSPIKCTKIIIALWDISSVETKHESGPQVELMRKHGYRYLREIEVRRADNKLYTFKECNFPRLCINDIEDILLLVVQNRLTNLLGNDVFDFAIALRMFTRGMVI